MTTPADPDLVVRTGAPGDEEAMADYHHRCSLAAFAQLVRPGGFDDLDPSRRVPVFAEWVDPSSPVDVRVAVAADRVVGHVAVAGNEIVHLFVDPDVWGRGLGKHLLEIGEQLITDAGHRTLELHTMVGNHPAIALYESAGWVVTDRLIHNEHDGLVYDEHVLIKGA